MKKNELLERWKSLGLLDGLDENKSLLVAEKYQEMAEFLLSSITENEIDKALVVCAFPIVRLLFKDGANNVKGYSPQKVKEEFSKRYYKVKEKCKTKNIDLESALCAEIYSVFKNSNNSLKRII